MSLPEARLQRGGCENSRLFKARHSSDKGRPLVYVLSNSQIFFPDWAKNVEGLYRLVKGNYLVPDMAGNAVKVARL